MFREDILEVCEARSKNQRQKDVTNLCHMLEEEIDHILHKFSFLLRKNPEGENQCERMYQDLSYIYESILMRRHGWDREKAREYLENLLEELRNE